MIEMILVVIAIFLFLVAIGLYLIMKQKKSEYKDVKKEKIAFFVLVIISILLVLLHFFIPLGETPKEDNNPFNDLPEEIFSAEVTLSFANPVDCAPNFCLEGSVETVKSGNFSEGQPIIVETDCQILTYGKVEVKGEENEKGIFAKCGDVIDLGIDPMMYEMPGEGHGVIQ